MLSLVSGGFRIRKTDRSHLYGLQGKAHDQNGSKRAKVTDDDDDETIATLTCTKRIANEHLIDLVWLDDSEMVAVGVNPVTLIAQLPPSLKEKHFGVS